MRADMMAGATSSGRRLLKRAFCCGIVVIALVAAAEAGLRLAGFGDPPLAAVDPRIEYLPKPGSYRRFGNLIAINRHGMRSADWGSSLPPREAHVALFGDSIVYGTHALDQSQTVAARLQATLSAGNARPFVVSAIAASSWGPANLLAYYEEKGPFPGRVAVLLLSSHDIDDYPTFRSEAIPYRTRAPACALHDLILSVRGRVSATEPVEGQLGQTDRERLTSLAISQLLGLLRRDFDRVLMLFHPALAELEGSHRAEAHFAALAAQSGVEFASLGSTYGAARAAGASVFLDDLHLDEQGTQLVARWLADWMAGR